MVFLYISFINKDDEDRSDNDQESDEEAFERARSNLNRI